MTRAVFSSFLLLGLACSAAAQPAADASVAGWNECLKTPTRACVLRRAVEVARTIDAPRVAAADLSRIAEAQSKAGLSAEAAERSPNACRSRRQLLTIVTVMW